MTPCRWYLSETTFPPIIKLLLALLKGFFLHVWANTLRTHSCRTGKKLTWTLELIPEQAKNNFNHWVGLQIHRGSKPYWSNIYKAAKQKSRCFLAPITQKGQLLASNLWKLFRSFLRRKLAAGDEKDAGGSVIEISDAVSNLYFVSGNLEVFTEEPKLHELPVGNLAKAAAHWWKVSPY